MTGLNRSLERDTFLSRSFCIERLTEPNPEKGLLEMFGEERALGVAFLLGPKGKRERRVRKAGMPELAGGVLDRPGEKPMPGGRCVLEPLALNDGRRAEAVENTPPPFFDWMGIFEVRGEAMAVY